MTANEMTIDHALQATLKVRRDEIAWFKTLDDDTVERIADTAPLEAPEYEFASAELKRRADMQSRGHSARVSPMRRDG